MSSETALVIVVALLWGPTMLWLLFRIARGPTRHKEFGIRDASAGSSRQTTPASADLNALVDTFGFWLCGSCKSLNRGEARRCYSCRGARDGATTPASGVPSTVPTAGPVPMNATSWTAVGPGRSVPATEGAEPALAVAATVVVGAAAASGSPVSTVAGAPATSGTPIPAGSPELSETATPVSAPATAASSPAAPPAGVPIPAPAPRAGLAVCPFVGLDGDPSTWFDFPDPNNQCHAIQPDDGTLVASVLRRVGARPSARLLDAETQRSRCLTTAHRDCARYLVAMNVLANVHAVELAGVAPVGSPVVQAGAAKLATSSGAQLPAPGLGSRRPARRHDAAPQAAMTDPAASVAAEAQRSEATGAMPAAGDVPLPGGTSGSISTAKTPSDGRTPGPQTGSTPSGARGGTGGTVVDQPSVTPSVRPAMKRGTTPGTAEAAAPDAGGPRQPATEPVSEAPQQRRKRTRASTAATKKRAPSDNATTKSRKSGSPASRGSRSSGS